MCFCAIGTTVARSRTSAWSFELVFANAIECAPDPPPTSTIRRIPSVPTACTIARAAVSALRCMAAIETLRLFRVTTCQRRQIGCGARLDGTRQRTPRSPHVNRAHERRPCVLGRARNQVARRIRRVAETFALLYQGSDGNERIQQRLGSSQIRLKPRSDLGRGRAGPTALKAFFHSDAKPRASAVGNHSTASSKSRVA